MFLLFAACTKWTDVAVPAHWQDVEPDFANDAVATRFMLGNYEKAMREMGPLHGQGSRLCGEYADELRWLGTGGPEEAFLQAKLDSSNPFLPSLWTPAYACIAGCNTVLEGLRDEPRVTPSLRAYLLGEARLLRALNYFYLVNLFDRVPLVTGTNVEENVQLPQASRSDVYAQLVEDLREAARLLPVVHPQAAADTLRRTRPELGAAHGLLARVYLYLGNYASAAYYATLVIESGQYRLASPLSTSFAYGSEEVIFQLKPVNGRYQTAEGFLFLRETNGRPVYALTPGVLQAFSAGDERLAAWTKFKRHGNEDYYSPFKYRIRSHQPRSEYNVALRLGEVYLIRAEARARLDDAAGALADLGQLRGRAGLAPLPAITDMDSLLLHIARERQVELFCEWGHRFLDLKRWSSLADAGDVLQRYAAAALAKKAGWQGYKVHFPLPQQELQKNKKLVQNPGY